MDPDQLATAKTMVPLSRTAVGGDARWQCATREPEGPPWLWGRRYQTRFFFRLSDIACGSYLPRQCNCGARTHCLGTLKICTHILSNPLIRSHGHGCVGHRTTEEPPTRLTQLYNYRSAACSAASWPVCVPMRPPNPTGVQTTVSLYSCTWHPPRAPPVPTPYAYPPLTLSTTPRPRLPRREFPWLSGAGHVLLASNRLCSAESRPRVATQ